MEETDDNFNPDSPPHVNPNGAVPSGVDGTQAPEKPPDVRAISCFKVREFFRIDRKLIFYKLFYLTFLAGLGAALPYVSVYLKQMGLSPEAIGVLFGIRPIIGFCSAPLIGMLGDRFGIRRCLLLISIVAWLAFFVGLFYVPAPERSTVPCSERKPPTPSRDPGISLLLHGSHEDILKEDIGWIYYPGSVHWVFTISMILILGGEVVQSPTTALSDAGTLQTLGSSNLDDYGAQRAWGSIGWGIRYTCHTALRLAPWRICFLEYRVIYFCMS